MNYEQVKATAIAAHNAGICVMPPRQDGSKAPDASAWEKYQKYKSDLEEIERWYSRPRTGVGIILGAVSAIDGATLEAIDFDDRGAYTEFKTLAEKSGLGDVLQRIEDGYLEHSPNGAHLLYRFQGVDSSKKLAKLSSGKTYIETKSDGGYVIIAPTYGSVNKSGSYSLISGGFDTICAITPDEREALHDIARTFDQTPAKVSSVGPRTDWEDEGRPGDDFIRRTTWSDVLDPHGWKLVYRKGEQEAWRRPGKDVGISATTNHGGSDLLYLFSTSVRGLDEGRGYNRFSVYAHLNHDGDMQSAAEDLALLGYGDEFEGVDYDISHLEPPTKAEGKPTERAIEFPSDLLSVPGMVGEIADYINNCAVYPQPILSLGAAIAATSAVVGRKVWTESGMCANIYVLGVGPTGCGKENARQAIRRLFDAAGCSELSEIEKPASDSSINTALDEGPVRLFLLDEIGRIFSAIGSGKSPAHLTQQVDTYLTLYGASQGRYYGKSYANKDNNVEIQMPHLSIYGTSVPGKLYDSISTDQIDDGFLTRFLVFETMHRPKPRDIRLPIPPDDLVREIQSWWIIGRSDLGYVECNPRIVKETPDAKRIYRDLSDEMHEKLSAEGEQYAGVYTRVHGTAIKLGLIRACGMRSDNPEVAESDAIWGAKLATYLAERFADRVRTDVSRNHTERRFKRITKLLGRRGQRGVTLSDMGNYFRDVEPRDRKAALKDLVDSGEIVVVKEKRSKSARKPTTVFYTRGSEPVTFEETANEDRP